VEKEKDMKRSAYR